MERVVWLGIIFYKRVRSTETKRLTKNRFGDTKNRFGDTIMFNTTTNKLFQRISSSSTLDNTF